MHGTNTHFRCHSSVSGSPKCTKIVVGWGFAPDSTAGSNSTLTDLLAGFEGPASKGRGIEGRAAKMIYPPDAMP